MEIVFRSVPKTTNAFGANSPRIAIAYWPHHRRLVHVKVNVVIKDRQKPSVTAEAMGQVFHYRILICCV
jgi:hypothetical protein